MKKENESKLVVGNVVTNEVKPVQPSGSGGSLYPAEYEAKFSGKMDEPKISPITLPMESIVEEIRKLLLEFEENYPDNYPMMILEHVLPDHTFYFNYQAENGQRLQREGTWSQNGGIVKIQISGINL